jgi:DNA-binding transcriptional LysR family regulator
LIGRKALARTSLEHWAVLAAVVDEDGFGQAAEALHKSQSAVSYAVARLQESLGIDLLEVDGRKAVLTAHGKTLLKRARPLLRDLETLEQLAQSLKQGWEPELKLVVDVAFPRQYLLAIIAELQQRCPNTEVQVSDAVLSGAEEAIIENRADVVVTSHLPPDYLGELLLTVSFVAVAYPSHPLFALDRALTSNDLVRYVQVVVRDSGIKNPRDEGWLGAERRFTVLRDRVSRPRICVVTGAHDFRTHPTGTVAVAAAGDGRITPGVLASRPRAAGDGRTGGPRSRRNLSAPPTLPGRPGGV